MFSIRRSIIVHFIKLLFTMFMFCYRATLIQVRHSITKVHNLLWTLVIIIDIIKATFDVAWWLAVYLII